MSETCPNCEGSGYIKSRYTVCYEVLRELKRACKKGEGKTFNIHLSPEVAGLLYEEEKSSLEHIETAYKTKVNLIANPAFSIDKFNIEGVK
jgi:ribonuclease G